MCPTSVLAGAHGGGLDVTAESKSTIVAVTGSVGVGTGKVVVAGTFGMNVIKNDVLASLANSSTLSGSVGDVNVEASENSYIFSFGGGFAGGKTAGVGLAFSVSLMESAARSVVSNTTLRNSGAVNVHSGLKGVLTNIAVGAAGGKTAGIAGTIGVNVLDNTVEAKIIDNSNILVTAL